MGINRTVNPLFRQIIHFGAILYTLITVINSLFLPSMYELGGDNYLFPFGFIYLLIVFKEKPRFRWVAISFCLYSLWLSIITYVNGNLSVDTLLSSAQILKWPVIIAVILHDAKANERQLEFLVDVIFLILVGMNLFMLLNFNGLGQHFQNLFAQKDYINFIYYHEPGTYRLSGTFSNPNDNGYVFGLFTIYYLLHRGISAWYFSVLGFIFILLSQSRTCLIGMSVPMLVWGIINLKVWSRKKLLTLVPIIVLVISAFSYYSVNLRSILMGSAFKSNSFSIRYENLRHFTEGHYNQLIGRGFIENELAEFGAYIDSGIIAVLIQTGYIGLILFLFIWVSVTFLKEKGRRSALFSAIAFILICTLTNFILLNGYSIGISAFLIGVLSLKKVSSTPTNNPKADNPIALNIG